MKHLLFAAAVLVTAPAFAEFDTTAPAHVKNLAGCFAVSYRFVEDGKHDYPLLSTHEWITLKEKEGTFTVQHYGLFGEGVIMKHFAENWTALPEGRWRQTVVSPSGTFRYTCESALRFGQLRCDAKGAPKPQRDTKRRDYEKLNRSNTIQITPKGWVQSEVNEKVDAKGKVIATEVGWVEYNKLTDEKVCEEAKKQHPQD